MQCSLCRERLKISAKQNTSVLNNYFFFVTTVLSDSVGPTLHYCCVTLRGAMLCSISWFVVLGCVYAVLCSILLYLIRKVYIRIKLNWFCIMFRVLQLTLVTNSAAPLSS